MNTQLHHHLAQHTPTIPLKELFGYAPFDRPRYSPALAYYTFLAPTPEGAPTIWIQKADKSSPATPLVPSRPRPITNYQWLHNETHILFIQDTNGDEKGKLYVCDISTGALITLNPAPGSRVIPVISLSPQHPNTIVFQSNMREESLHDVYAYDITTHTLSCIATNPGNIFSWHIDNNLEVRACTTVASDSSVTLYTRETSGSEWHKRLTWLPENSWNSKVLSYSPDNTFLYFVDNRYSDTSLLQRIEIAGNGESEKLFSDPSYDIYHESCLTDILDKNNPSSSTLWDTQGNFVGFSYYAQRLVWHFFVNAATHPDSTLHAFLTQPQFESWIDHSSPRTLIIGRCSDVSPTEFWAYSRQNKTLSFLGHSRPALQKYSFSPTISVHTTTPDGLTLQGYLTLPPAAQYMPVPLVLKIHGGPWARDVFGFSAEVQMLANHGYACLQVNYRGSAGFGYQFSLASRHKLGTAMIDDVICMTEDMLKRFPLDAEHMGYMGRSYGGFSALAAGGLYQHLFNVFIAQVPPSSLTLFSKVYAKHWSNALFHFNERIGHPERDAAMLEAQSPLTYASVNKKPLFISYGMNDGRVPPEHIQRYIDAMDKTIPHQVICFEDEGHFNQKESNILSHWHTILEFIARHI